MKGNLDEAGASFEYVWRNTERVHRPRLGSRLGLLLVELARDPQAEIEIENLVKQLVCNDDDLRHMSSDNIDELDVDLKNFHEFATANLDPPLRRRVFRSLKESSCS